MKNIFVAFILLVTLGLTGCKSFPSTEIKVDPTSVEKKSIVVLEVGAPKKTILFGNVRLGVSNQWARVDNKYFSTDPLVYSFTNMGFIGGHSAGYSAHMIEPGMYVLEYIQYHVGNSIIKSVGRGFSRKHKLPRRAFFVVKPGENIYIGDISIGGEEFINVEDNFDAAQKFFQEKYPNVKTPLVKRLAI